MLRPWYARIRTPWSVNAHGLPTNFVFESKSFRSDRPRVAHPRKGVHEVVHAAAVVREDPDAVERERAWVADELRVRIEKLQIGSAARSSSPEGSTRSRPCCGRGTRGSGRRGA